MTGIFDVCAMHICLPVHQVNRLMQRYTFNCSAEFIHLRLNFVECVIVEKVIKEQSERLTETGDQIAAAVQV